MQQRERQREIVVNMRSSGARTGEQLDAPALCRIVEDVSGDERHGAFFAERRPTQSGESNRHADRMPMYATAAFDRGGGEYSEYENSTLASDVEATFENYEMYRDDVSETSSFVTNESEFEECSRYQRPTNHVNITTREATDLNPLFENLNLLTEFGHVHKQSKAHGTFDNSTVARYHVDEWTAQGGGGCTLGTDQQPFIWTPLPPSSAINSVTTTNWSSESPQAPPVRPVSSVADHHRGSRPSSNTGQHNMNHAQFLADSQTPPVTLTGEELLPAHLLDDLEGSVSLDNQLLGVRSKHEQEEPKKKSWFGLGRCRRSLSVPSSQEAGFTELKYGVSNHSLCDRLLQRSKFFSGDLQSDFKDTTPTSNDQTDFHGYVLGTPPGF